MCRVGLAVAVGVLASTATQAAGQELTLQASAPTSAATDLDPSASFSLRPDVNCRDGVCDIYLKAYAEGTTVSTENALAYPYDVLVGAETYEPREIAQSALVDRLPGSYGYMLGFEDRETTVIVEPLASLGRLNVFAVEQQGGSEEVRQAHYLFWIDGEGVEPILQRVDGPGPVVADLRLTEEAVIYTRRYDPQKDLSHLDTYEAFFWVLQNDVETLVPRSKADDPM